MLQNVCGDLYPRVAIQLPMFNERAVCQAAIDSACEQSWPKGRLIVQVPPPSPLPPPLHLGTRSMPPLSGFARVLFACGPLPSPALSGPA